MSKSKTANKWFFSGLVTASFSERMKAAAKGLEKAGMKAEAGVIVAHASEILEGGDLPIWSGRLNTKFLLLIDVPQQAIILLPSKLNLRRPEQRLNVSPDPGSLRRLIIAQFRDRPLEGIVDAFLLPGGLEVVSGDLQRRRFSIAEVPALKGLSPKYWAEFTIDPDGSSLQWEAHDIHLGVSELLMATDRDFRVEREIERAQIDNIAKVLAHMRATRGLCQSDISGLSGRQVRRLEKGDSHLTGDAAEKLARSFGMSTRDFLEELSRLSSYVLCSRGEQRSPDRSSEKLDVA